MEGVYSFEWDCGRNGSIEGLFIADSSNVANAIGKQVYFGEVLGKHSEVFGTLEKDEIVLITEDQDFITACRKIFKYDTLSGYNPLDYLDDNPDEN